MNINLVLEFKSLIASCFYTNSFHLLSPDIDRRSGTFFYTQNQFSKQHSAFRLISLFCHCCSVPFLERPSLKINKPLLKMFIWYTLRHHLIVKHLNSRHQVYVLFIHNIHIHSAVRIHIHTFTHNANHTLATHSQNHSTTMCWTNNGVLSFKVNLLSRREPRNKFWCNTSCKLHKINMAREKCKVLYIHRIGKHTTTG